MISMSRMSAMLVSMKQTIFAIMFLMSETTTESELGTRGKFISICLMFIDFLQVSNCGICYLFTSSVDDHAPWLTLRALQVLRTTVSVSLGWSLESEAVVSQASFPRPPTLPNCLLFPMFIYPRDRIFAIDANAVRSPVRMLPI
jgi:hypothetical protein